jgi:alpha-glucosidase
MEIFRDGINADRYASDYKRETLEVSGDLKMKIHMAPGGGWVAKLSPR